MQIVRRCEHCRVVQLETTYRQVKPFLLVTDILFSVYWAVTILVAIGLLAISPEYLYNDYYNEYVTAWNWSFFPLDVLFAVTGFWAVRLHAQGSPNWFPMAFLSMVLTFCAGFMAISYWTIRQEFDPAWWVPNMLLVLWPLMFLPRFFRLFREQSD